MVKNKTITSFFKRTNEEQQVEGIDDEIQESKCQKGSTSDPVIGPAACNEQPSEIPQANINEVDVSSLERDPAKRLEIKCHDELQKAKAIEIKKLLELVKSNREKEKISLVNMFDVTRAVLRGIMDNTTRNTRAQRGDASMAYSYLKSFEFVFVLHMMKKVMQKTDALCQGLQKKSQDILNAMDLVSATKINIDHLVLLVEKYYPTDFTEQERNQLVCQLETFQVERINNAKLSEVATLSDLCQTLVETGKNSMYDLVERVCRLLLTLPVSTATTERGFSAMKIFKNRLRNKMSDENLANSMVIYIEKEIADKFDSESIIEEFKGLKGFKMTF
ncbi:hypothetical protein CTI12_AA503670 [Artemisia annua]|uniref:HAT C-terminal dimerisation domain-containing protein n=1 Tax=Artemisia annua TaxID=35608 RepID=A0A2U1LCF5_ARTAN|nr:hypothetical protein CTI12_AA503670 [Artemisia annua]